MFNKLKGAVNPKRCQACITAHKQCDLQRPTCGRCQERHIECDYNKGIRIKLVKGHDNNKSKSSNPLRFLECTCNNTIRIKYRNNNSKSSKFYSCNCNQESSSLKKQLLLANNVKKRFFEALSLAIHFAKSQTNVQCYAKMKHTAFLVNRNYVESFMTSLQYPSLEYSIDAIAYQVRLFSQVHQQVMDEWSLQLCLIKELSIQTHLNQLLNTSIQAYMCQMNRAFPLFEIEGFEISQKPLLVRFTMMACGLCLLPNEPSVAYLIDYFEGTLKTMLYPLSNLKPSLSNVQALIMLALGFRSSPTFNDSSYTFLNLAFQLSTSLGLGYASIESKKAHKREAAMAYICLNTLTLGESLWFGYRVLTPQPFNSLSIKWKKIKLKYQNEELKLQGAIDKILIYYYSELSELLYELRLLKESYLNYNQNLKELDRKTHDILSKLGQLKDKYYIYLMYPTIINDTSSSITLTPHQNYILFLHHHLTYFTLAFKLYHPLNPDQRYSKPLNQVTKILKQAIEHATLALNYATHIPISMILPFGFYYLTEIILFILRFQTPASSASGSAACPTLNSICNYDIVLNPQLQLLNLKLPYIQLQALKKVMTYFEKVRWLPFLSLQIRFCAIFVLEKLDALFPLVRKFEL